MPIYVPSNGGVKIILGSKLRLEDKLAHLLTKLCSKNCLAAFCFGASAFKMNSESEYILSLFDLWPCDTNLCKRTTLAEQVEALAEQ